MRARTVNEAMNFQRGGNAKRTLEVGRTSINRLIKKSIQPKAEEHKWDLSGWAFKDVLSYQRMLTKGVQTVRSGITLIEKSESSLHDDEGLDDFLLDGHIVEVDRWSSTGSKPNENISTYHNPLDLWEESWWEKLDEQDRKEGFII